MVDFVLQTEQVKGYLMQTPSFGAPNNSVCGPKCQQAGIPSELAI